MYHLERKKEIMTDNDNATSDNITASLNDTVTEDISNNTASVTQTKNESTNNVNSPNNAQDMTFSQQEQGQFNNNEIIVDPDDPLLIAQTLTYVTDDGSVVLSFTSAPFSFGKNAC